MAGVKIVLKRTRRCRRSAFLLPLLILLLLTSFLLKATRAISYIAARDNRAENVDALRGCARLKSVPGKSYRIIVVTGMKIDLGEPLRGSLPTFLYTCSWSCCSLRGYSF